MNNFVISAGGYSRQLSEIAFEVALKTGKVNFDIGGPACGVPLATNYIKTIHDCGNLDKRKKTARC